MYPRPKYPLWVPGFHTLYKVQLSSPDVNSASSLMVKGKNKLLPCDKEEDIFIKYTIVGDAQGSVDVMYLVSGG